MWRVSTSHEESLHRRAYKNTTRNNGGLCYDSQRREPEGSIGRCAPKAGGRVNGMANFERRVSDEFADSLYKQAAQIISQYVVAGIFGEALLAC